MPPVIGAAVAAGLATAFATSAAIVAAGGFGAFFMQQLVLNVALSYAAKALAPKPKVPDIQVRGRDQQFKQPITARDIVYGEVRQSGPVMYVESTEDDKYLHMVIALAGHEIDSIQAYYFDDEELTVDGSGNVTSPSKYDGLARLKFHNGSPDQAADPDLVAESDGLWTNSHRLRGVAYVYMRLQFDSDAYPNGVPNFSAIVRGKDLYDPRTTTTGYSNNAALAILDYLRDSQNGLGAPDSEIDFTSFEDAADICDETVTKIAGSVEPRYLLNGVVDTADTPKTIISSMLTSCGGSLVYSGGKWVLKVGAYTSPVREITLDDIVGDVQVQTRTSRRSGYNAVKGVFVSPEFNWQPTDYPAITSTVFEAEDNSERKFLDLELPYTTSSAMAQRIAKMTLYKERQQIGVQLRCSLRLIDTVVGDVVTLTLPRLGWAQKTFEIIGWSLSPSTDGMYVDLSLKETSAAVYDWNAEERELLLDNTNLPNPFIVDSPGIALSDELVTFNEQAVTVLVAEISASNEFVTEFEVQAKRSTDADYVNLGRASGNRFELPNVEDNVVYDVRARAINSLGIRSPFSNAQRTIVGKTAPPSDVSNFKVNIIGNEAHLSWEAVTDLDLSHYRIRHSSETSGAVYSNSLDIARKVSRPATSVVVEAKTGTYFIKAVDKLGNNSTNAASSVAIINKVGTGNVLSTIDETTTPFGGAFTNCSLVSGSILLNTGQTQGIYLFEFDLDLGAKYQTKFSTFLELQRFDRSNLFDDAGGLFDSRDGLFDGDTADFDDINVSIQLRHTDDNPTQDPTWSDWREFTTTEIAARAFEFRAVLNADNDSVSPQINDLKVIADMPDRVVADSDLSSGTSGYTVTFSPAFKALQGISVTASNLGSGDYYEITSKSVSGFTITFKNSSGTNVDRTFDYVARGYGEIIT